MKKFVTFFSFSRIFVTLLLAGWLTGPAFAGPYEMGLKVYEEGNYAMAAFYFQKATTESNSSPNAHYYLADSYVKLKKLPEAQAEYQKILAMAPDSQAARMSRLGLAKLHEYMDRTHQTEDWQQSSSGGAALVDRYSGPVNGEDYLDNVTENGKLVRWSLTKMPLKVYIEQSPPGIRNFQPAFILQARKALDVWVGVLGHQISYQLVNAKENADIRVTWTNTIDTQGHSTDGGTAYTAGLMIPKMKDEQIQYMEVKISTFDIQNHPQSVDTIYAVAVHELGHSLGLLGHSGNEADIMYAQNQFVRAPSKRDMTTIRKLYASAADVDNLPADSHEKSADRQKELALKMDESIRKLEAQTKTDDMALTWLNLGVSYFQKAKQVDKVKDAQDPKNPSTLPAYWFQKALQATNEAIKREPKDPRAYHKRSLVYQELNNLPAAVTDIEKAISIDRTEAEYYLLKSWYLAKQGQVAQARGTLDTYLLYKPTEADSADVQKIRKVISQTSAEKAAK